MNNKIKRYELNDNITTDLLIKMGFRTGGYIKNITSPKYSYDQYLSDCIYAHIEISESKSGTLNFDDYTNIYVIDDNFCQPYYPFYREDADFKALNEIINNYNNFMDRLVEKGIFKEKQLENDIQTKKLTNDRH